VKANAQNIITTVYITACLLIVNGSVSNAREVIHLTADSAVGIAMDKGYRINMLKLAMKRNYSNLYAERAALRSKAYMNLKTPEYAAVSDYRWNSTLRKDEIIHTDTRRWQVDFTIEQPVILLGHPTNGYLSLNNKLYKYIQKQDVGSDIDYYNRVFLQFEQPIFLPNRLKNDIERAELNLKSEELQNIADNANEIIGVSFTFYDLFEMVHRDTIYTRYVYDLENISKMAKGISRNDPSRDIDAVQAEIELAHAREMRLENKRDIRDRSVGLKQRLGLTVEDSLVVKHDIKIVPVDVDIEKALQYGYTLKPRLPIMSIGTRRTEIDLINTRGQGAFPLEFEVTFGIDKNEDYYRAMWDDYDNSYSFKLSAYVPIWDWGRRKDNIEAAEISLKRSKLYMDEIRESISNDIDVAVNNHRDYRRRVQSMEENLTTAMKTYELSIDQYRNGKMTIQGVLKAIERRKDLEENFLEAYIGYRGALLMLLSQTHYDYESGLPLTEKYGLGREN